MPGTEVALLNQLLEDAKVIAPAGLTNSQIIVLFSTEQILKDFDLSTDELVVGITDGGADGGIDSIYTFADENLVDEDFDPSKLPTGYSLDLYIVQDKQGTSFTETPFDKLAISLPVLLDLTASLSTPTYSAELIQRIEIFRGLLRKTARKFPKVRVHVIYSAKASTTSISPRVTARARELEAQINGIIGPNTTATVMFQGARELLDIAGREPSRTLELPFTSRAERTGQNSYVGLVPIKGYAEFLSDDAGRIKRFIFESNVRDFQGENTQVNRAIRESLSAPESPENPDFWWLNNGITILASEVTINGGRFIIKDPQIVNGLQTSVSIHEHFRAATPGTSDDRLVLVKIIETNDEDVRNAIIVATNSQTNLLPSAIKAADDVQRDIERYFARNGVYYDRRKNYYKNLGKAADLIFAVPYLAQAILSIGFSEPDQARARPSSLIKRDADYGRIFSTSTSLEAYLWVAKLQRAVDKKIKTLSVSQGFKTNMRFHLSMIVAYHLANEIVRSPAQLQPLFTTEPDLDTILPDLAVELDGHLQAFITDNPGVSVDRAAKSRDFVQYLIESNAGITPTE